MSIARFEEGLLVVGMLFETGLSAARCRSAIDGVAFMLEFMFCGSDWLGNISLR